MSYGGGSSIAGGRFEQALKNNKQIDIKCRFIIPSYRNSLLE